MHNLRSLIHSQILDASEVFNLLLQTTGFTFLDVRAPIEFVDGHFPGFHNSPILTTEERHQVGICYRNEGQSAAIALGEKLTAPEKESRIEVWVRLIGKNQPILSCFRGGLRSQYASRWLSEKNIQPLVVKGGYKALRRHAIQFLEKPKDIVVLTGFTGSHKTKLLQESGIRAIDLEGIAKHRGSSFGGFSKIPQPGQATFENYLAIEFHRLGSGKVILEDESLLIGKVHLTQKLKDQMKEAPIVFLECDLKERVKNIFDEYVTQSFQEGVSVNELATRLLNQTENLRKRLGNEKTDRIRFEISRSFIKGVDLAVHAPWIELLLTEYYDPRYQFALQQQNRKPLHRGNYSSCLEFLKKEL